MTNIEIKATGTTQEETYTAIACDITLNGTKIGSISLMVDDSGTYIERIDINETHRSNGYGTQAIKMIAGQYDTVYAAPDNEGSQRLLARIGSTYTAAPYADQGYGVYSV